MKSIHIAYAGCPPEFVKKLNLAAELLYANGYIASVAVWRGGRSLDSHLYVGGEDDDFAMKVAALARKNEIPVLIAHSSKLNMLKGGLCTSHSAHSIYKSLINALTQTNPKENSEQPSSILTQLSEAKDELIELKSANGESVIFNFNSGFCRAKNKFSLESTAQSLLQKSTWLNKLSAKEDRGFTGIQTSIENYIFHALIYRLDISFEPELPKKLKHWPDITLSDYSQELAKISATLNSRATSIKELNKYYTERFLVAYYWAIHIAKITEFNNNIDVQKPLNHQNQASAASGTLSKLIYWLGRNF